MPFPIGITRVMHRLLKTINKESYAKQPRVGYLRQQSHPRISPSSNYMQQPISSRQMSHEKQKHILGNSNLGREFHFLHLIIKHQAQTLLMVLYEYFSYYYYIFNVSLLMVLDEYFSYYYYQFNIRGSYGKAWNCRRRIWKT